MLDSLSEIKSRIWSWQLFVLLLKHWSFLREACGREGDKKKKEGEGVLRCIHMWKLKAVTIFPSLLWPHMAYGILLRASQQNSILYLSAPLPCLCLLTNSHLDWLPASLLCPQYYRTSISCLHVPFLSVMIVYNETQSKMLAGRPTGVSDNCFTVG